MTETHPHAIFVYGTLKSGFNNNPIIQRYGGKFIAPAKTTQMYVLNDSFPFVWEVPERALMKYQNLMGQVIGEVYRVNDDGLMACDRLEGHPNFYRRTNIGVSLLKVPHPIFLTAGIYLAQSPLPSYENGLQRPIDGTLEWCR